ncbi:hypothetical protein L861_17330 [Litchfieldella anticariensis FP35 = DSM 16096]|uniref:NADP-dependent oxidoreductase domain-containing protein n=1 Tax=Litchfieldella anticariensis (strain DSM 16096 / CECT 5854 / CIP 108499 / LMG 22089 / FP35) TaxID=1121939 RepID=S2KN04_LITA3|nr:aldo/keto reductase [Halomonas anticariensis]EPC03305.1 hypothetical protein L861_17330 [Halomonas anticariensis FP35 = DSM 16096]
MMAKRKLAWNGPEIGYLGYDAMVLEGCYGGSGIERAIDVVHRALDAGMTMIDTADAYGNGHNEALVGKALRGRRDEAFIATKFGIVFDEEESGTDFLTGWNLPLKINGRSEYVRKALDISLRRLDVEEIDLWYMHYTDPGTPIEETVGAMEDAVRAGKVRYLGLSNVTAEEVRRAHAIHPITAVHYEYSLWRREAEEDLLPTLRELGISLVAWSPLGSDFAKTNRDRFEPFMGIAKELGITPAQLALAWVLHQGDDIIPVPGTRRPERIDENAKAADIALDITTLHRIDELARPGMSEGAAFV